MATRRLPNQSNQNHQPKTPAVGWSGTTVLDKHLTPEHAMERTTDRTELEGMLGKVMRAAA